MNNLKLDIEALIDSPGLKQAALSARLEISGLAKSAEKDAEKMNSSFSKLTKTLQGVFSLDNAKEFVSQLIKVRGEFQQTEIAFSTLLQSKEKADALMQQVTEFAAKAPFSVAEITAGAEQLLKYGTASESVTDTLSMLGNIASGLSAPMGEIVTLYTSLQASGSLGQEDFDKIAQQGIPIYQALADLMGKNTTQIQEMAAAGQIGFPEVQSAFERLTGVGGQFYDLMSVGSETLAGQMSSLGNAWTLMLNDIGQSQEGVLSGGIGVLTTMVENYETVLNILGVLVTTYGAYRAAVIANTAVQAIATMTTNGYTVAEALRYQTMLISERGMKILNATMLSNPFVAVTVALGALVATLVLFNDASDAAARYQNELNEQNKKAAELAEQRKQKYGELTAVLRDVNQTEFEKNNAFKELQALYPSLFNNLTKEEFLKKSAAQAQRELNEANDQIKVDQLGKQFENAQKRVEELTNAVENYKSGVEIAGNQGAGLPTQSELRENLEAARDIARELGNEFEKQTKELMLSKMTDAEKLTYYKKQKEQIEQQLNFFKEINRNAPKLAGFSSGWGIEGLQKQLDTTSKQINAIEKKEKLNKLEEEKIAITKQANKAENKQATERINFLQKLKNKEAEINSKTDSENKDEVKRAQKEYGELRKQADKLKLGKGVKQRIENAEKEEVGYLKYEKETKQLEKNLAEQKQLYADFEEHKKTFGEAQAKERFKGKIDVEKSYLEHVENLNKQFEGKTNLTAKEGERKELVNKEFQEAKAAEDKLRDKELAEALEATKTYQQKELEIKKDHEKKLNALLKEQNGEVSKEQRAALERNQQEALDAAKHEALVKTEVYKKANQEVFNLSRDRVKIELSALKQLINSGAITGEAKKQIEQNIEKLEFTLKIGVDQARLNSLEQNLKDKIDELNANDNGISLVNKDDLKRLKNEITELQEQINKLRNPSGSVKSKFAQGLAQHFDYLKGSSQKFAEGVAKDLGQLSGSFNELSQAFGGTDTQAGYLMDTIGGLLKVGSDAAGAFASFASGDIIGGVTKTISAVTGIFSIGKKVKEMNAKARQEVADFYANAIAGERAYQELLKERALQTVRDNKTRLNGIQAEIELRESQLAAYNKESAEIMAKTNASRVSEIKLMFGKTLQMVQGLSYIKSEEYVHGTWFRKAKVNKTYGSLAGMSFEQLNQLLAEGRLEGEAKALVERLKELEQKGFEAEKAIKDLRNELDQLFTGTTAEGLTDSLLTMFKEGKTGAQDFASFFENAMQDAALSVFKNRVLAEAMDAFYKDFAAASQDGDGLNTDKIANLKSLFNSLMADANTQFDNLRAVTGLTLGGSGKSNSTLTEAVKGMTADQAGLIAGQFGGQRLAAIEGNELKRQGNETAMQQLAQAKQNGLMLVKIEDNTRRNADSTEQYLPYLKEIASKMNNNNALRAAGG